MGRNFAEDLALMPNLSMESAIGMHLRANHYPPVPLSMVSICIEAIDAYWEDDISREITLPEGISWKGKESAPAWAIIENHHLDAWCMETEE
jgi:hypothetical protein